jgi:hypothetical protein
MRAEAKTARAALGRLGARGRTTRILDDVRDLVLAYATAARHSICSRPRGGSSGRPGTGAGIHARGHRQRDHGCVEGRWIREIACPCGTRGESFEVQKGSQDLVSWTIRISSVAYIRGQRGWHYRISGTNSDRVADSCSDTRPGSPGFEANQRPGRSWAEANFRALQLWRAAGGSRFCWRARCFLFRRPASYQSDRKGGEVENRGPPLR